MRDAERTLKDALAALAQKNYLEAELLARTVLRAEPTSAHALHVLACTHTDRGDDDEALRLYEQSIRYDPNLTASYHSLARAYYGRGRLQDLATLYKGWANVEPGNPEVRHMVAATTGATIPSRCSVAYVQHHFDEFAEIFDDVLVRRLEYRGPQVIAAMLQSHAAVPGTIGSVLDAGCGTGLCGPLLRPYCRTLVGVDLSERMLERARARECYDQLVKSDIVEFLRARPAEFCAVIACDVLIYFGELSDIFEAAYIAVRRTGLFIFTVEALNDDADDAFRLQPSGRYAHRQKSIEKAAEATGFRVIAIERESLRRERDQKPIFYCVVLSR